MSNVAKRNALVIYEYIKNYGILIPRQDGKFQVKKEDKVLNVYNDTSALTEVFDLVDLDDNTKYYIDHQDEYIIFFEDVNIFVDYKAFVSSEYYEAEDNGDKIIAKSRIQSIPKFSRKVDISNNETIFKSSYSLKLQNVDGFYDQTVFSGFFKNKPISVISIIDGVEKKLSQGTITEFKLSGRSVSVKFAERNVLQTEAISPIGFANVPLEKFSGSGIKEEDAQDYKPIIAGRVFNLPLKNINQIREDDYQPIINSAISRVTGISKGVVQIEGSNDVVKTILDNIYSSDNVLIGDSIKGTITAPNYDTFGIPLPEAEKTPIDPDGTTYGRISIYPPARVDLLNPGTSLKVKKKDGLNFNNEFYVGKIPTANVGIFNGAMYMALNFSATIGSDIVTITDALTGLPAKLKEGDNLYIPLFVTSNEYIASYRIETIIDPTTYKLDRKVYKTSDTARTDLVKRVKIKETFLTRDIVEHFFKLPDASSMTQVDTNKEHAWITIPKPDLRSYTSDVINRDDVGDILQVYWWGHGTTTNTAPNVEYMEQWEDLKIVPVEIADGDTASDIALKTVNAINDSSSAAHKICHASLDDENNIYLRLNQPSKLDAFLGIEGAAFLNANTGFQKRCCYEVKAVQGSSATYQEIMVELDRKAIQKEYGKRKEIGNVNFKYADNEGITKNLRKVLRSNDEESKKEDLNPQDMIFSFLRQNKEFIVSESNNEDSERFFFEITAAANGFVNPANPIDTLTLDTTFGLEVGQVLQEIQAGNSKPKLVVWSIDRGTNQIEVRLNQYSNLNPQTNFVIGDIFHTNTFGKSFWVTEQLPTYDGTSEFIGNTFAVEPFEMEHDTEVVADVIDGRSGYGIPRILEDIASNVFGLDTANPFGRTKLEFNSFSNVQEEIGIVIKENVQFYEVLKPFLKSFDNVAYITLNSTEDDYQITTKAVELDVQNADFVLANSSVRDFNLKSEDKILEKVDIMVNKSYDSGDFNLIEKNPTSFILDNILTREENKEIETIVSNPSSNYSIDYFNKFFRKRFDIEIFSKAELLNLELMDRVEFQQTQGNPTVLIFYVTNIETNGYDTKITLSIFPALTNQTFFIIDEALNFIIDENENNLIGGV